MILRQNSKVKITKLLGEERARGNKTQKQPMKGKITTHKGNFLLLGAYT